MLGQIAYRRFRHIPHLLQQNFCHQHNFTLAQHFGLVAWLDDRASAHLPLSSLEQYHARELALADQCGLLCALPAPWVWWAVEWLPWAGRRTRQRIRRQGPKEARPSSQRGCVIWSARHGRLSRAGLIVSFLPWPHAILNLWARQERGADGRKLSVLVPPLRIQLK